MFIDSHAHLYLPQFDDDIDEVIQRAIESNVQKIFLPNIDSSTTEAMFALVEKYPNVCYPMMGLHPCSVKENYEEELAHIKEIKESRKIYGVGELGIDLYWDKSFKEQQILAFQTQIEWAIEWKLPIIIHSREALSLTIEIVENLQHPDLTGVFHCFAGTLEQAERIRALGFYMGIGGVSTFKNGGMDKTLPDMDLDGLILETDSPYLPPVPYRGKRNESSYIPIVAERIALLKDIALEEVMKKTTYNSQQLFGLASSET